MCRQWTAKSELAKVVYAAGFEYDPQDKIITTRLDALERFAGYAYAYDLLAPITISAVIDCEPIFFHYDRKHWMIELWKGQYEIKTGCEIGIYVYPSEGFWITNKIRDHIWGKRPHDPENSKFFRCAHHENEPLKMSFTLLKNGTPLLKRALQSHWWLTGFKWGVLSTPEELAMEACIEFTDSKMRSAFVHALRKMGYQKIDIDGEKVQFVFDKPKSRQPRFEYSKDHLKRFQENNSKLVDVYKSLSLKSDDPNDIPDEVASTSRLIKSTKKLIGKSAFRLFHKNVDELVRKYEKLLFGDGARPDSIKDNLWRFL